MVRIRFAARALIAAAAAALALHASAVAQALQRLTPTSFVLSSDTATPQLQVPFRLTISLHVKENVGSIDRIILPVLSDLEVQGDERRTQSAGNGTDYRETLIVVARHTGTIDISPVALQAIDGRDGKPKEFYTNSLRLQVMGGPLEPIEQGTNVLTAVWTFLRNLVVWVVGIACVAIVAVLFFRRRPQTVPAAPVPAPPPRPLSTASRSKRDQLQDALSVLRAEPTRASAIRVRSAVWRMVGAPDGETFDQVCVKWGIDGKMREVLWTLERAAFTYDDDVSHAIDRACAALEDALA